MSTDRPVSPYDAALNKLAGLGPGTYVLLFSIVADIRVTVGRLGDQTFARGDYAYVGSALGPGGLAARLGHHLGSAGRTHWHLDYLCPFFRPLEIWCTASSHHFEHVWAKALMAIRGANTPVPGFGASDCRCPAHLVAFGRRPRVQTFRRRLRQVLHPPPRVRRLVLKPL